MIMLRPTAQVPERARQSCLHHILVVAVLIVRDKTRAPTIRTPAFIVGAFVNNALSFTLWTGFHSEIPIFFSLAPA
jgi:hypothetical protein